MHFRNPRSTHLINSFTLFSFEGIRKYNLKKAEAFSSLLMFFENYTEENKMYFY
jgi:hypothetical protein